MDDDVLCIFGDGRAHGVGEIAKAVPLPESRFGRFWTFWPNSSSSSMTRGKGRRGRTPRG